MVDQGTHPDITVWAQLLTASVVLPKNYVLNIVYVIQMYDDPWVVLCDCSSTCVHLSIRKIRWVSWKSSIFQSRTCIYSGVECNITWTNSWRRIYSENKQITDRWLSSSVISESMASPAMSGLPLKPTRRHGFTLNSLTRSRIILANMVRWRVWTFSPSGLLSLLKTWTMWIRKLSNQ